MSANDTNPKLDVVIADYLRAVEVGAAPDRLEIVRKHPELANDLESFFTNEDQFEQAMLEAAGTHPLDQHEVHPCKQPQINYETLAGDTPQTRTRVGYFGQYELLCEIARGGMGVVYKARQSNLNRIVAIKMILAGHLADKEDVRRFYFEAEAAASLDHPGIVPIFEVGQFQGQHYFSMGFIEGKSLADHIMNGPLPSKEAATLTKMIAQAIAYAHGKGVIHRDLKPANVLLDAKGEPKITDFGLAKRTDGDSGLTRTGSVIGTPSFMSPEQASGNTDDVGPRSDVYSMGAILYCLLTGRPPFQAATVLDTLHQVIEQEPISLRVMNSAVPIDLEIVCGKCLEKNPQDRYQTAEIVGEELERFLKGEPILSRRMNPLLRFVRRSIRRHSTIWRIAASFLIFLLMWLSFKGYQRWDQGLVTFTTGFQTKTALTLELMRDMDGKVVQRIGVPTTSPLPLASGDYWAQFVNDTGQAEKWQMHVPRGRETSHQLYPSGEELWRMNVENGQWQTAVQNGKQVVLVSTPDQLTLFDGATAKVKWNVELELRKLLGSDNAGIAAFESFRLLQPLHDLDGDGVGDLTLTPENNGSVSVLVLSGKTGQRMWHRASNDLGFAFSPTFIDVNSDGVEDILSLFLDVSAVTSGVAGLGHLAAISGVAGETLWSLPIDPSHHPSGPAGNRRLDRFIPAKGSLQLQLQLVNIDGNTFAICSVENQIIAVNATTGIVVWEPVVLESALLRPLRFFRTDLGLAMLTVLTDAKSKNGAVVLESWLLSGDRREKLWRLDPSTHRMDPSINELPGWHLSNAVQLVDGDSDWPLVVDLNADGKDEIVVPASSFANDQAIYALDSGGRPLWSWNRLSYERNRSLDKFFALTGCTTRDIDSDGWEDFFVVVPLHSSIEDDSPAAAFGVVSGKTGETLRGFEISARVVGHSDIFGEIRIEWLSEFQRIDEFGDPLCAVSTPDGVRVFSSRTGDVSFRWDSPSTGAKVVDLDEDGMPELLGPVAGRNLQAITMQGKSLWHRLGTWQAGQDYDGDGFADLVSSTQAGGIKSPISAISGRSGERLWTTTSSATQATCLSLPFGDLNKDTVPDIVLFNHAMSFQDKFEPNSLTISALSGTNGQRLWKASLEGLSAKHVSGRNSLAPEGYDSFQLISVPDVDGDESNDLYLAFPMIMERDSQDPLRSGSQEVAYWQGMISGRRGQILWQRTIANPLGNAGFESLRPPQIADLDGDHLVDLVCILPSVEKDSSTSSEDSGMVCAATAIRGSDGKLLWRHPLPSKTTYFSTMESAIPLDIGDLDADGSVEVVIAGDDGEVSVRSGATGASHWSWKSPHGLGNSRYVCLVDTDGNERKEVYVWTNTGHPYSFFVLDHRGQLIKHADSQDFVKRLRAKDLDADGVEELVVECHGSLFSFDDGVEEVKWRLVGDLREITTVEGGTQITVATVDNNLARPTGFMFFDGNTGSMIWQFRVPLHLRAQAKYLWNGTAAPSFLQTSGSRDLYEHGTICRSAWGAD